MNDPHELDWLAFQYIADELSPDEAVAFELRLADDQAAREAVARAVELSQISAAALAVQPVCVTIAEQPNTSDASVQPAVRSWPRALWWMSCGAAACLVALVGYEAWRSSGESVGPARSAPSAELAAAWSETREQSRTAAYPELTTEVLAGLKDIKDLQEFMAEIAGPDSEETGREDHETPSWIVAALSPEDDQPHDGQAGPEDELMNSPSGTQGEG